MEQVLVRTLYEGLGALQGPTALGGDLQRIGAAVRRVALALDEALRLEMVDDRDHRRSIAAQQKAQPLLGDGALVLEDRQRAELADLEPDLLEGLVPDLAGCEMSLREQIADVVGNRAGQRRRRRGRRGGRGGCGLKSH